MAVQSTNIGTHYTYRVTWSTEDNEYIGLCAEFPSLSWLADSQQSALQGIVNVVAEAISDMESANETIPEPLFDKMYSGTFTLRVPPDTHRALAIRAAESHISINRLINAKLMD